MVSIREEEYLEKIGEIVKEKGYAKIKDISKALNLVPSTVTEMMRKLEKEGLVNYEKYSGVTLTELGKKKIDKLTIKHETLKKFFLIIGLDEEKAEEDACIIEHVISPTTIDKLIKFVDYLENSISYRCLEELKRFREKNRE